MFGITVVQVFVSLKNKKTKKKKSDRFFGCGFVIQTQVSANDIFSFL